jgi:hypothetical protein
VNVADDGRRLAAISELSDYRSPTSLFLTKRRRLAMYPFLRLLVMGALGLAVGACTLDPWGTQQLEVDHFYTADAAERQSALANDNYLDEGIACYIFKEEVYGTAEFFRLYNPGATDHFYTTDAEEKASALAAGYQDEGSVGYIFPTLGAAKVTIVNAVDVLVPLYRVFNPEKTDHFYTTDVAERDSALATGGYLDEEIAGYVFPDQSAVLDAFPSVEDKTAALYRLYLP